MEGDTAPHTRGGLGKRDRLGGPVPAEAQQFDGATTKLQPTTHGRLAEKKNEHARYLADDVDPSESERQVGHTAGDLAVRACLPGGCFSGHGRG